LNQLESLFAEGFADRNIKFEIEPGDPGMMLYADEHQIEQILVNLIKNASESIENVEEGMVRVEVSTHGKRIELRVEDNGPGISDKIRDQIFVPFFSTKPGGTGIGLSLSRQIMNNHDGTIQFSSIPNERTIFTLSF
jgi:signal transduction histidine kinase